MLLLHQKPRWGRCALMNFYTQDQLKMTVTYLWFIISLIFKLIICVHLNLGSVETSNWVRPKDLGL